MEEKSQIPDITKLMAEIDGLSGDNRMLRAVTHAAKPMKPEQRVTFVKNLTEPRK